MKIFFFLSYFILPFNLLVNASANDIIGDILTGVEKPSIANINNITSKSPDELEKGLQLAAANELQVVNVVDTTTPINSGKVPHKLASEDDKTRANTDINDPVILQVHPDGIDNNAPTKIGYSARHNDMSGSLNESITLCYNYRCNSRVLLIVLVISCVMPVIIGFTLYSVLTR